MRIKRTERLLLGEVGGRLHGRGDTEVGLRDMERGEAGQEHMTKLRERGGTGWRNLQKVQFNWKE